MNILYEVMKSKRIKNFFFEIGHGRQILGCVTQNIVLKVKCN